MCRKYLQKFSLTALYKYEEFCDCARVFFWNVTQGNLDQTTAWQACPCVVYQKSILLFK